MSTTHCDKTTLLNSQSSKVENWTSPLNYNSQTEDSRHPNDK